VKRVPKKFSSKYGYSTLEMPPGCWLSQVVLRVAQRKKPRNSKD